MVVHVSKTLTYLSLATSLAVGMLAGVPTVAHADPKAPANGSLNANKQGQNYFDYTAKQGGVPKDLNDKVGVEQKLDAQVPLNLEFKDEDGKTVTLGQYFGKKPVMITMLQLTCDQVCSAQLGAMAVSLNELQFTAGKEFELITVSIDPRESPLIAKDAKEEQVKGYNRPGVEQGWHFLTGTEKNTKALANALGIKYIWEPGSKQYIHPDGIVLVTPDGHISRYFLQLNYNPRDLRFSLIEASKQKIGSFVDQIALSCFHYNPVTGKYTFQIMAFLRVAAIAFIAGGLLAIGLMLSWDKKRRANAGTGTTAVAGS